MVSEADVISTFPVMSQLRTHLKENEYLETVERMRRSGYRLAAVVDGGHVRCVAGFRIVEFLAHGKFLYVDDLVTAGDARSEGHGERMLDWLAGVARKRAAGLSSLTLGFNGTRRTGFTSGKE